MYHSQDENPISLFWSSEFLLPKRPRSNRLLALNNIINNARWDFPVFRIHEFKLVSWAAHEFKLVSWKLVSWAAKKTRFVKTRFVSSKKKLVSWKLVSWAATKNSFRENSFREQTKKLVSWAISRVSWAKVLTRLVNSEHCNLCWFQIHARVITAQIWKGSRTKGRSLWRELPSLNKILGPPPFRPDPQWVYVLRNFVVINFSFPPNY